MDPDKFTESLTGQLVKFGKSSGEWAFVPDPLPTSWEFVTDLWPLLADAKEALGTLNGIGQTLTDPQLLLRPLQSREAISSSSIEGTYVTPEQLLLYQLDPKDPASGDEAAGDWREVFNYGQALVHGCELLKTIPISNRLIKGVHNVLMRGARGNNKTPGEFRKWQVQIGSSGRFIPAPVQHVPDLMGTLEAYINGPDERFDPLIRCFLVHYQFETIHPFADGNGRVGRLLLALMIYKCLGHSHPWLYLSAYFEKYKEEYISNLFAVSADGRWREWVEFCLRGTIQQAKDSIRRCHQFNELRRTLHEKTDSPSSRTHGIIERLFTHPVITTGFVQVEFEVCYNTAKRDLDKLVKDGILREILEHYPKSYYAPDIMRVAYDEQIESSSDSNDPNASPPPF